MIFEQLQFLESVKIKLILKEQKANKRTKLI